MARAEQDRTKNRPAGYAFLSERYKLRAVPNWHLSSVGPTGTLRSTVHNGRLATVYPLSYWPGEGTGEHLAFALKYDGVNPGLLSALFRVVPTEEIRAWIQSKPAGKYERKIWFFYEFLTGRPLPIPPLTRGNDILLLEADQYYTTAPGRRVSRQRVIDNLLGEKDFCPILRRTRTLAAMEDIDWRQRCEETVGAYGAELLRRAAAWLYNKETRSSFEIEHIKPGASRMEKFISLLHRAAQEDFCDKARLIELQNRITDPRFHATDYRTGQSYVGQTISFRKLRIHYACPKPDDLQGLMAGLLTCHRMMTGRCCAAPAPRRCHFLSDSSSCIRSKTATDVFTAFLIHNILALRGLVPQGLIFPVSAAMLNNRALYDQTLEAFSRPLMQQVDYEMDSLGQMRVQGETASLYRYIDMTRPGRGFVHFCPAHC